MDVQAEEAHRHSDEVQRNREDALRRIEGYHEYIDNCTSDMQMHEADANENRERITRQIDMIQQRRAEAEVNRSEAEKKYPHGRKGRRAKTKAVLKPVNQGGKVGSMQNIDF